MDVISLRYLQMIPREAACSWDRLIYRLERLTWADLTRALIAEGGAEAAGLLFDLPVSPAARAGLGTGVWRHC